MDERADGLRRGVSHDGVQHHLAVRAYDALTLVAVGARHNVTDLLQQLDHNGLQEQRGGTAEDRMSVDLQCCAGQIVLLTTSVCLND